jgi:hypothetical protein
MALEEIDRYEWLGGGGWGWGVGGTTGQILTFVAG